MRNPQKFPLPKREFVFWGPPVSRLPKTGDSPKLGTQRPLPKNAESAKLGTLSIPLPENRDSRKSGTLSPSSRFP